MSPDKTDDEENKAKNQAVEILLMSHQSLITKIKRKRIVTGKENSLTSEEHRLLVSEVADALL